LGRPFSDSGRDGSLGGNALVAPEESLMGRRLYVGNLAWTVTDQDLQEAFSEVGQVDSSQVIMDRATNRSRGFGFVEMATEEAADAAVKKLNGREIKGRPIRVNEAQARGTGGGPGGGGSGGGGGGRGRDR
jgi:RNA recognition motif-containing protein